MMLSKVESGEDNGSDSSSGRLLRDIEEISRALYPHKTPPNNVISTSDRRSKSAGRTRFAESNTNFFNEDMLHKNKKSSIWNWNPLKALTHIRNHRFNCWFFLHVHAIEGFPTNFNDISLCVQWKRKDEVLQTRPARICQGVAEFEETLMHRCSVYASGNGHHHLAKYEPKLSLLYASVIGAPGLDLGKHWIDLTRLLPLTLEELEEEKSTGKWTTSFKLTGKAKGAKINVSFGFSVMGDSRLESGRTMNIPKLLNESKQSTRDHTVDIGQDSGSGMLWRVGSVPSNSNRGSHLPTRSLDIKFLNEVYPNRGSELGRSITFLYQKFDEPKLGGSQEFDSYREHIEPFKPKPSYFPETSADNIENESLNTEFAVIEQGIELSMKEQWKLEGSAQTFCDCAIETIDVAEIFKDDEAAVDGEMRCDSTDEVYGDLKDHFVMENGRCEGNGIGEIEGFESVDYNLSVSKSVKMVKSLSLDDLTESVANDFLKMVAVEKIPLDLSAGSEPESPRELLLRQFEEEGLASIDIFLNLDGEEEPVDFSVADPTAECGDLSDNFDLPLLIRAAEEDEDPEMVGQSLRSKRNAELLENLETEFLMKEWGLNEDVFQNSPRTTSGGFGSPIYFPAQEPLEFPPLGEGLGPIVQTKDGALWRYYSTGHPVGFEKMSLQVNKLMPMEDINGKMMQQVAWEVGSRLGAPERVLQQEDGQISIATKMKIKEYPIDWGYKDLTLSSVRDDIDSDYVSLEDLAPLAMDKIEALSIEGLRIQSGMSDEEAPSRIRPQSIGKTSAFLGKSVKIGGSFIWEGAAELQLSGVKDNCDDDDVVIDELISLSITLDEWMRLDAFRDEEEIDERTSKILAAHVADIDFISSMLTRGTKWDKPTGRSCGLLGNNFTVALRVQLRDPLRDYETVGAPMLALVQVERFFVDLKPKVYQRVSQRRDGNEEDDLFEEIVDGVNAEENREERIEECIPWFKITEVHLVGFNTELGKKQQWGTTTQEQSGTRWLLATGMGRNTNHLYLQSNAIVKSSSQGMHKMQLGDTMWSISSHVHGPRAKWKELATLNLHIRNPDVIFQT
ncbi:hypothetical protein Acr_10g0009190 [Actinidia rufa]|uniref:C2 NT-type domain-containing protein n=1 Tax=Actinidia rufa TaxID=165716 RepID=A0A7J0FA16_9ERIC|nr:hypothetical protein Acr_10g0009190 [Actinidia rufa]